MRSRPILVPDNFQKGHKPLSRLNAIAMTFEESDSYIAIEEGYRDTESYTRPLIKTSIGGRRLAE